MQRWRDCGTCISASSLAMRSSGRKVSIFRNLITSASAVLVSRYW